MKVSKAQSQPLGSGFTIFVPDFDTDSFAIILDSDPSETAGSTDFPYLVSQRNHPETGVPSEMKKTAPFFALEAS